MPWAEHGASGGPSLAMGAARSMRTSAHPISLSRKVVEFLACSPLQRQHADSHETHTHTLTHSLTHSHARTHMHTHTRTPTHLLIHSLTHTHSLTHRGNAVYLDACTNRRSWRPRLHLCTCCRRSSSARRRRVACRRPTRRASLSQFAMGCRCTLHGASGGGDGGRRAHHCSPRLPRC